MAGSSPAAFTHRLCRSLTPSPPPGAKRVGVRWGLPQSSKNGRKNAVEIVDDLVVPEPDNPISVVRQFDRTCGLGVPPVGVLAAVELDRQLAGRAGEVHHATPDRVLAPKLPLRAEASPGASPGTSQCLPKPPFDLCGIASQSPCDHSPLSQCHGWPPPHPDPLRPKGGEAIVERLGLRMCESRRVKPGHDEHERRHVNPPENSGTRSPARQTTPADAPQIPPDPRTRTRSAARHPLCPPRSHPRTIAAAAASSAVAVPRLAPTSP
jgi:hypothetical protein